MSLARKIADTLGQGLRMQGSWSDEAAAFDDARERKLNHDSPEKTSTTNTTRSTT